MKHHPWPRPSSYSPPRPWTAILAASVLLAGAGLLGVAPRGPARAATAPQKVTVRIANFDFAPRVLVVPAGTTVTWVNGDDDAHDIVADNKSFRSHAMDTDESYSFTFSAPGEFTYHCGLHPRMTGKVVVRG